MKLYVWDYVLCDWTCGMIVVLAHSKAEAVALAVEEDPSAARRKPKVVKVDGRKRPVMFSVAGGG